jgi:hypothetical protein
VTNRIHPILYLSQFSLIPPYVQHSMYRLQICAGMVLLLLLIIWGRYMIEPGNAFGNNVVLFTYFLVCVHVHVRPPLLCLVSDGSLCMYCFGDTFCRLLFILIIPVTIHGDFDKRIQAGSDSRDAFLVLLLIVWIVTVFLEITFTTDLRDLE